MAPRALRPPLILAYHGIGTLPRALDPHNLMVPAESFRAQVRAVRSRGYEFVQMSEFARRLRAGGPPRGTCALTFDDGSADNHAVLPGLLDELGVPATVFACPGLPGEPHPDLEPGSGVRLLTREELRRLAALPAFEIGSHTSAHVDLSAADGERAYAEMAGSKAALEELIGAAVTSFAYPYCDYSAECPDAARRAGYTSAVTCEARGGWDPYELRRESVDSLDGRLSFALKSRGVFWAVRDSAPGRLARALARPVRHSGQDPPA